jgi:hypothetical protein
MAGKSPFKDQFGIPICPKCKITLREGPPFCPQCGMALRGRRLHLRMAMGCLLMLVGPASVFFLNYSAKDRSAPPGKGEIKVSSTEITVQPHTTYYSLMQPIRTGELVFRVEARDVPVGINAGPVGEDGFTPALDEKMREEPVDLAAGEKGEVTHPVVGGNKYGVFVINEGDKPAKAQITMLYRWGK